MDSKIAAMVLALVLLVSTVSALALTGMNYAAVNQCDSVKQKYTLCGEMGESYTISVQGEQSNWIKIAPSSVTLDTNACVDVYAFITPECYANSGNYDFNILVFGDENYPSNFRLNVNQAHTFDYIVTPLNRTSKPCQSSDYNITVKNTGKFVDEFVLVQKGLTDSWVSYPQTKFVVNPYSTYTGTMRVTSPCNADANTYSFELGLYNTKTNASSKVYLTKTITNFTPFIVNPLSESKEFKLNSCEEFDKNVSFNVINASDKNDELAFELLDENYALLNRDIAYFENSKVILDFNSSVVVSMMVKKRSLGDSNIIVKATSKAYSKSYFYPLELSVKDCYDLNMVEDASIDLNASRKTCASSADAVVNFVNNGSQRLDFNANVYVNGVLTESKPMVVDTNTMIKEVFKITASSIPSTLTVKVEVKAPFINEALEYPFSFEKCFDADMDVSKILVCKNGYLSQKFTVKNEGTMKARFNASIDSNWINLSSDEFDLNAGESKEVTLYGNVPLSYADEQTILIESSSVSVSKSVPLVTLSNEECNDLEFVIPEIVDANCCEGEVVPLIIRNDGYFAQMIGINALRPEWVSVSDSNMFLLPKSEGTVYVHIAPSAGNGGDFNAQIVLITDRNIQRDANFKVHVFGEKCVVPEGFNSDTNSKVTDINGMKITEVKFDFVITNDSNEDFTVSNISVDDLNAIVKFDSNTLLKPNQSMTASIIAWFSGSVPADKNVSVVIETSNGPITKTALISFNGEDQSLSIAGWFGAYTAPVLGILLLAIVVVIAVLLFGPAKKKKNGFRK